MGSPTRSGDSGGIDGGIDGDSETRGGDDRTPGAVTKATAVRRAAIKA